MTLTLAAATLRARILRELVRIRARSWEGGPHIVWRDGTLIADDDTELTEEHVTRLAALPDGAGAERVWEVLR